MTTQQEYAASANHDLTRAGTEYQTHEQALRFAVVGLSGVAINTLFLSVLHTVLSLPLTVSVALAAEVAMINNYLWNDRWTFGCNEASFVRLIKFNLCSLGGLIIAVVTTTVLAGHGIPYIMANLVGIAAAASCNFLASKLWIWRMVS